MFSNKLLVYVAEILMVKKKIVLQSVQSILLFKKGIYTFLLEKQLNLVFGSYRQIQMEAVGSRTAWISIQKKLLELEREAEIESSKAQIEEISLKQLQAKGIVLCNLVLVGQSTGLFGHHVITLSPKPRPGLPASLPSHSFSSGDIAGLWENSAPSNQGSQIVSGIISKVTPSVIHLAIDEESADVDCYVDGSVLRLHKLANDVTYRRIKNGLEAVEKFSPGPSAHLMEVLLGETEPYVPMLSVPATLLKSDGMLDLQNRMLDYSQISAVEFAMKQKDLAIVHGPPGTGKTTTLVEIIYQCVRLGSKVLAVAPSNLAVDNLLEKLIDTGLKVVRIGHPARATQKAQLRTLAALLHSSDEGELLKDIHSDIKRNLTDLSKTKDKGRRNRIKSDLKEYRKELRERESGMLKQILSQCNVVLATLTSVGNDGPLRLLSDEHFDVTVIDECSQGLESACYLSAMKSPKLLLAGDHQQLPPTVLSTEAASKGLMKSLMERVIELYQNRVTRMLSVQYRMHSDIMEWASKSLYDNQLKAHSSVASHLLKDIKGIDANEITENCMVLIDTAGCGFEEMSGEDLSKGNEGEAGIIAAHVKALVLSGVPESDIAVISPYNLQVEMVRDLLRECHPKVEVRSVDGFQGREKEAIVITLVRSNRQGEIGFLSEDRRLNVAVTRARRHLALVCDTETVCKHPFIKSLVDHLTSRGLFKSGFEYENEINLYSSGTSYFGPRLSNVEGRKKDKTEQDNRLTNIERRKREKTEFRRKEFWKLILDFLNSGSKVLKFPPELNSFDRMLVHDMAAHTQLTHESIGEGKDRYVVLRKVDGVDYLNVKPPFEEMDGQPFPVNKTLMKSIKCNVETQNRKDVTTEGSFGCDNVSKDSLSPEKHSSECIIDNHVNKELMPSEESDSKCGESSAPLSSEERDTKCGENITYKLPSGVSEVVVSTEKNEDNKKGENRSRRKIEKNKESRVEKCSKDELKICVKDEEEERSVRPKDEDKVALMVVRPKDEDKVASMVVRPKDEVKVALKVCPGCGKEVPLRNFDLHTVQCERKKKLRKIKQEIDRKKVEIGTGVKKQIDEKDDFELMEAFQKENNSCAFPRCKNRSVVLLQLCPFCKNNFCLSHHQAEIHGCGEEARKHARTVLIKSVKDGVLTPGSGIPSKKPNPVTRAHLQRKLDKKLDSLAGQRQPKKKDGV